MKKFFQLKSLNLKAHQPRVKKFLKTMALIVVLFCLSVSYQNCSKVGFSASDPKISSPQNNLSGEPVANNPPDHNPPANNPPANNPPPSSPPPSSSTVPVNCHLENLTIPIKLMFVVDSSGSNQGATQERGTKFCGSDPSICAPATDPSKTFRGGSISEFFKSYSAKTNFSWAFNIFAGQGSTALIAASSGAPSFGNASQMEAAIAKFSKAKDWDATPYLAALQGAYEAIANDSDLASSTHNPPLYYIVFMSDGYPTDAIKTDGNVDSDKVNDAISNILALAPTRIKLSSIYYGTINDPAAAKLLQNMATQGHGDFLNIDTSTKKSIAIGDLIQIPVGQCH